MSDVFFRWEIQFPAGRIREERAEFEMRWFYRYEVEHLLARVGLVIEELYGDWDRSPLGPDSPEMIFVCRPA